VEKGLGVMMKSLWKLISDCEMGIYALVSCWHKGYEIDVNYAVKIGV
jgi:hypothetical protein